MWLSFAGGGGGQLLSLAQGGDGSLSLSFLGIGIMCMVVWKIDIHVACPNGPYRWHG